MEVFGSGDEWEECWRADTVTSTRTFISTPHLLVRCATLEMIKKRIRTILQPLRPNIWYQMHEYKICKKFR